MLIATKYNDTKNLKVEFYQVTAGAYEVLKYRTDTNGNWKSCASWYFNLFYQAEMHFINLKLK